MHPIFPIISIILQFNMNNTIKTSKRKENLAIERAEFKRIPLNQQQERIK